MTEFERAYTILMGGNFEVAQGIFEELHKNESTEIQVRADSLYMLGWICYKEPSIFNYHQADFWFKKASELKQEQAQFCLGQIYEYGGNGIKANPSDAFFWYSLAVINSNKAMENLASEIWKSIAVDAMIRTEKALLDKQKAEINEKIGEWTASHP